MKTKIPNQVTVSEIPDCDMCLGLGVLTPADYDAMIPGKGCWGNVCQRHFTMYNCKLGVGAGQRLVLACLAAFLILFGYGSAYAAQPGMLSPHFSKAEFAPRDLPSQSFSISPVLINKMEILRTIVKNRPIIITSGFRTPKHNQDVGGAKHSQHLLGKAADIKVSGVDPRMLANYARIAGFSFVKVYADHVHVDVR